MPPAAQTLFPAPALRLFFSVDIVGSTAYKQSAKADPTAERSGQPWLPAFSAFFTEIELNLRKQWESSLSNLGQELKTRINDPPVFWKAAGDEVIYSLLITDPIQPLFVLATLRETINVYRPLLKKVSPNLDLKAAAWLAGFPVNNAEVVLGGREAESDDWFLGHFLQLYRYHEAVQAKKPPVGFLDFIGPQLDLGFRLSAKATPRRMMISVDLALMLVDAAQAHDDKWTGRFQMMDQIFFAGTESLKGVLSGIPYPLLWLDMRPDRELNKAEDEAANIAPPKLDKVKAYCEMFIEKVGVNHSWVIRPFIASANYGEPPRSHLEDIARIQDRWSRAYKSFLDVQAASAKPLPQPSRSAAMSALAVIGEFFDAAMKAQAAVNAARIANAGAKATQPPIVTAPINNVAPTAQETPNPLSATIAAAPEIASAVPPAPPSEIAVTAQDKVAAGELAAKALPKTPKPGLRKRRGRSRPNQ